MGWVEGVKMGTDWYNDRIAKERQDRLDAQNKQLFDSKMEEINQAKLERQQLGDAAKPAQTSGSDAALDLGNGQKVYEMPRGIDSTNVASSDARQFRRDQAATTGVEPALPQVQPAQPFTMNGQAFPDRASMQTAVAEYDNPQARSKRMEDVLNLQGNPMGAMQLANAAKESKLNDFKLSDAETAQVNKKFNTRLDEVSGRYPDKWMGLAAFGTETQVGEMAGATVRVQSDGINMRFTSTMPDGSERSGPSYPNTPEGYAQARSDLMKLDPESKSKVLAEQVKSVKDAKKDDADIKLKGAHSAYYGSMAEVAGRKVDVTAGNLSDIDKLELGSLGKQKDRINEAIIKAQAEGSFGPSTPGASSLTTQLAALTLKERQITQKYSSTTAPDPLGFRKPTTSEAQMKVQATGDMGPDPKAIQREIDKTTADIGTVKDEASKAALQAYLVDLQRQQGALPANSAPQAAAKPSAKPASLPPPVVSPKAPGVTMTGTVAQSYNEAGYVDTNSTIDGAARGDQKALALLKKLIPMGETTPAQRARIQKLIAGT